MRRQITLFVLLLVMINTFAGAQSNYFIDQLMDKKQATYGEAAFMALSAAKPQAASSSKRAEIRGFSSFK